MNNHIQWNPLSYQQIHLLQNESLDELVDSYRNGFRIPTGNILKLGTSSCPSGSQVIAGSVKTVSITPSGGTPPYTINWKVDGTLANTWSNIQSGQSQTLSWSFNESVGSHTYLAEVKDSCPSGMRSDSTSCTINVISPTTQPPTTQPPTTQPPTTQPPITQPPTTQPPITGCINCDLTNNICIANQCIPKNYAVYGGIGLIALILMILI